MARSTSRERIGLSEIVVLSLVLTASLLVVHGEAVAQAPFLSYDFDDGKLDDFIVPTGGGDLCGTPIPSGPVEVVEGEVVMKNDEQGLGISMFGLLPDVVQANFPEPRDYKLRVRFRFGEVNSVTQFQVYLRARLSVDVAAQTFDSSAERGYSFSVIPELILLQKGCASVPCSSRLTRVLRCNVIASATWCWRWGSQSWASPKRRATSAPRTAKHGASMGPAAYRSHKPRSCIRLAT